MDLRAGWRLARLALHLSYGAALAASVLPWLGMSRREKLIRSWSAHILSILHVRVNTTGVAPGPGTTTALIVANHVSWLDIWAINGSCYVRFIAKSEVRDWPLIGWLAGKVGVIFIERARRHDTSRVANEGAAALIAGHHVCVFAEGTTTDGTHVLPFRSSLLQIAVDAEKTVCPLALKYLREDGQPDTGVAYAGDTSLWDSMKEILSRREVRLHMSFLPLIDATGRDRRTLAAMAEQAIAAEVRLPVRAAPGIPSGPPA